MKQARVSRNRSAKTKDVKQLQAGSKSDSAKERTCSVVRRLAEDVSKSHLAQDCPVRTAAAR